MTTRTLRLPEDLAAAIRQVGKLEAIEESSAMRKLLRMGLDLYTARLYGQGRITLRQAAKRMQRSVPEAVDALAELGIRGNTTADDTLASVRSIRARR